MACLPAFQVYVSYWSQCRSNQIFKHAKEFRPDRWLDSAEQADTAQQDAALLHNEAAAAGGPASCPATGHGGLMDDASGGCPFLRAQGLTASQGAQAAASTGLSGGALTAPANQSTLAQALSKFGTAAKAVLRLERYTGRPGEAPQAPGTLKGTPLEPTWQGAVGAYNPFGHGGRTCPAKNLAMMELRLFMIRMLSQYRVTYPDAAAVEPLEAVTAATNHKGVGKVLFTKRVPASTAA